MPSFLFSSGSFFPNGFPIVRTPVAGATVQLPKGTMDVYLTPAGTLATLTIKMPSSPNPGQVVSILSSAAVTALTVQNYAGVAVAGAPTSLVANTNVYLTWLNGAWVTTSNIMSAPVMATATVTAPAGVLAGKAQTTTHPPAHK